MKKSRQEAAFEGVVRDIASDGRAVVAHPDGRAFFVSGAWLGERVLVTPTGRKGDLGFGVVREILEPSCDRREPPCGHHGVGSGFCGGCPWMFVAYEAQADVKQARVRGLVERLLLLSSKDAGKGAGRQGAGNDNKSIGENEAVSAIQGSLESVLRPIRVASAEFGYRNRAQFKTDGSRLGYVAAGTNELVDIETCPVLNTTTSAQLAELRQALPNREWKSDRRNGIYWHTLDIDDQLPEARLDGRLPFRQGNTEQNTYMREWLAQQVRTLPADTPVLELFAGAGNFTEVLCDHFDAISAVEGDAESIASLRHWAEQGVTPWQCDLFSEEQVTNLVMKTKSAQLLVLDPPRDGLKVRGPFIAGLKKLESIIYVSCDPATWARDCRDFLQAGFYLETVQPVDQFPQTPHVEVLSVLRRRPRRP